MKLDKLFYTIKGKTILNSIDLTINENGLYSIIGPNGAGKTTILKIMGNIITPTKGSYLLDNKNIKSLSKEQIMKKTVFFSQYQKLFHKISVLYFLQLNRYLVTKKIKTDKEIEKLIEIFQLDELKKRSLDSLSGGERQRVLLASIFLLEREYIFLDEPFTYIDLNYRLKLGNIISNIYGKKHKIIMVTHHFDIISYSNYTIGMKNGKIKWFKTLLKKEDIIELFDIDRNLNYLPII